MESTRNEISEFTTLVVEDIRFILDYEGPESFVEAVYSVDKLIAMDESQDIFIGHDAGFAISSLGIVSLFAGTITLFTMDS